MTTHFSPENGDLDNLLVPHKVKPAKKEYG